MRPEIFDADLLFKCLKKRKIASMGELKEVLGTRVDKTVARKLKKLSCLTSYSHRGKYYALKDVATFDENGLWIYHSVCFSMYGTLLNTVNSFVEKSEAGYCAHELDDILHVKCKESLLHLYKKKAIYREKISGTYVYFSADVSTRRHQVQLRAVREETPHELRAAIILFFSTLDEKQRRLYSGLESIKLGHGGDRKLSELLGIDVHTVAKGRRELLHGDVDLKRVRKPGGGRKDIKKNASDN